jgi:hypothetical protein
MRVFVLLFNARTENEGIHTIQLGDRHKVLMFESEDDATRFGVMLEAQDFPEPAVEAIDDREIKEFCDTCARGRAGDPARRQCNTDSVAAGAGA